MKTKLISFGNQKGGVGKSTLTTLLANYISENTDYSIVVCDCDGREQKTLEVARKRDLKFLEGNFSDDDIDKLELYEILSVAATDFPDIYTKHLFGHVDLVLVDLPGALGHSGVKKSYVYVDYLFCPTNITNQDIDALAEYYRWYRDILDIRTKNGLNSSFVGLLSKVNPIINEYKEFRQSVIPNLPFPFMDSYIPKTEVIFSREFNTYKSYEAIEGINGKHKQLLNNFFAESMKILSLDVKKEIV